MPLEERPPIRLAQARFSRLTKMDKSRLRSTLRKLRQIPFDRTDPVDVAIAPQEMLDFLAMLSGLKPVFLLGRGFNDPRWIEGVSLIARSMKLHVISGPKWAAEPDDAGLPDWFHQSQPNTPKRDETAIYICKTRNTAIALTSACAQQSITIEQEAQLLGYPVCCVTEHYHRCRLMNAAVVRMLYRTADGDVDEMKRIVREDVGMTPETIEEIDDLKAAQYIMPGPFTSINMCRHAPVTRIALCADSLQNISR
jgi:hypothetical protein